MGQRVSGPRKTSLRRCLLSWDLHQQEGKEKPAMHILGKRVARSWAESQSPSSSSILKGKIVTRIGGMERLGLEQRIRSYEMEHSSTHITSIPSTSTGRSWQLGFMLQRSSRLKNTRCRQSHHAPAAARPSQCHSCLALARKGANPFLTPPSQPKGDCLVEVIL